MAIFHDDKPGERGAVLMTLAEIANGGELKPIVEEPRFNIADVGHAHDRLSSGKSFGKIVLDI